MKILTPAIYLFGCLFLVWSFTDSSQKEEVKLVLNFEATLPTAQKEGLKLIFRSEEKRNK